MHWYGSLATTLAAGALVALIAAGCSDESPIADAPAPTEIENTAIDPAPTGVIQARVTYAGLPDIDTVTIDKDVEQCGQQATIGRVVVGEEDGLANAVVSLPGVDAQPRSQGYTLDQRGCQFWPRVIAMLPGEIDIINSDGVLHNIHTYSEANAPINMAQPKSKRVMTESFTKPEIIRVTCDVHGWMEAWLVVLPNPFGVTGQSGVTWIEGVPPGTHTVEVWHEALGRRSQDVVVKAGETATVLFAYPEKT